MKIQLIDTNHNIVHTWNQIIPDQIGMAEIAIHQCSIFDKPTDAIVSPANSFGFMDGGVDNVISQHLGWHVQKNLQEIIKHKWHGELPVGMAEVIETKNADVPYLVSAPTMRVPCVIQGTVNPYLATRAAMLAVIEHNAKSTKLINTITFTGMGTGVGRVGPFNCARQMKAGIEAVLRNIPFPKTWYEARNNHDAIL